LVDLRDHAVLLALALLRADAPADGRQQVGLLDRPDRPSEVAVGHEAQEARDVDADRAARDARLVLAGEAPHRLGAGLLGGVGARHLAGVADALGRVLLRPEDPRQLASLLGREPLAVLDAGGDLFGGRIRRTLGHGPHPLPAGAAAPLSASRA